MTRAAAAWRIDPGPVGTATGTPLFAPAGEHARAMARLCRSAAANVLPDEVILHLHAYELLERLRDAEARGAARVQFPFWPASLFAGASVRAHAARELEACMPPPASVVCMLPGNGMIEQCALAVLGARRFDPRVYRWSLREQARARGWQLVGAGAETPAALPAPAAGVRATADAMLVRDGCLLLERRRDDARVRAGVWDTPGGHLEAGETPAQALVRELREELGIEVGAHRLAMELDDRDPTSGEQYRHHVFVVDTFSGDVAARQGQRLCWVPLSDCLHLHRLEPLARAAMIELLDRGWIAFL
jgi:mutator protein MutT